MAKRILSFILAALLLLTAVFACGCGETDVPDDPDTSDTDHPDEKQPEGEKEPDEPVAVTYAEPLSFTKNLTASCTDWTTTAIEKALSFSDETFTAANDTFNRDLAIAALYLLVAETNAAISENGTVIDLYNTMGLSDVKHVDLSQMNYAVDTNDITKITLAQKTFTAADGKSYQLITCVVNPVYGAAGWSSNFDVGADTQDYIDANGGESPDWIDKKEHKGFSVAAERVAQLIEIYADEVKAQDAQPIIFITGQSRGGAITNIASKHLIDRGQTVIGYGFNVPNTTTESDPAVRSSYKTIYNIVNQDDIVSDVPLTAWGFTRCGQDIVYSIAENPTAWETCFGVSYQYPDSEYIAPLAAALFSLAATREALYTFGDKQVIGVFDPATQSADIEKAMHPSLNAAALRCIQFTTEDIEGGTGVCYAVRPALVTVPLSGVVNTLLSGGNSTMALMGILPYMTYLSAYTSTLTGILTTVQSDTTFGDRFLYSHVLYTDFVGIEQIK